MSINLILGPMFSGKSTELIRRFNRYTIGGKKCLLVKYAEDTRYNNSCIVTHDKVMIKAHVCKYLIELEKIINDYDVICIDEIQFYQDAYIMCDYWANKGIIIEVCGLNGTFERKQFPIISRLIPLVENITYKTAICVETGCEAQFSDLRDDIKRSVTNSVVIGGLDKYSAVDRTTFNKNNMKINYINELQKVYKTDINKKINSVKEFVKMYV